VIEFVDVYWICFERLKISIQPSIRFSMTSKTYVNSLTGGEGIDGCSWLRKTFFFQQQQKKKKKI